MNKEEREVLILKVGFLIGKYSGKELGGKQKKLVELFLNNKELFKNKELRTIFKICIGNEQWEEIQ